MRTPSWSASVLMSDTRVIASEYTSAARVRFTSEAIWCAVWMARGSYSSERKVCSQATVQPISSSASRKNVRQKRLKPSFRPGRRSRWPVPSRGLGIVTWAPSSWAGLGLADCRPMATSERRSGRAVRHEHVAHAPHRLDVAGRRGVGLDQLAQARDLNVEAPVEGLELAAAGQLGQFFARQRLARMAHQRLQHREFAGGERKLLAILLERARTEIERKRPECHGFVLG